MKSVATPEFWDCYRRLPPAVRARARAAYRLWSADRRHPSLRFKPVSADGGIWSVRIGLSWRALGVVEDETVIWFWIGSHADYDRLLG